MATIKAVIVGISNYLHKGASDLPFCRNDIYAIREAFIHGLGVSPENIASCGEGGIVTVNDFVDLLQCVSKDTAADDTLLFYFSGHGTNIGRKHFLVLTNDFFNTQDLIKYLEDIPAKSKVLFLDCCHAGNFEVNGSAVFDVDAAVENFAGRGYAVFASSNALQESYSHPDKSMSLFTSFLHDALINKFIIREGKKSLNDIHKLLFLIIEAWNKCHPTLSQTPIYRANMGGTLYFNVEEYRPYVTKTYFYDAETYVIHSVEPIHSGIAKRYSVKVILKTPMPFSEMATINHEIINRVKFLDIYNGSRQELLWRNKPANLIFCYFGLSETDIINSNYICHTTWADETQDKNWWYKTGKNNETIDGISFCINPHYEYLKNYMMEHTASKAKLIAETKEIIHRLITLAEQIISIYNLFLNNEISESGLLDAISKLAPEINRLYFRETDLDISPNEIAEWSKRCTAIAGCIHDFTIYYTAKAFQDRTPENRKACMDMTIKQYYKDLEELKKLEKSL